MSANYIVARADTLHIPHTGETGHLFVVLTSPCREDNVLLAPVCSVKQRPDRTCLVGVGDHKFLTHDSYIMYAKMGIYAAKHISGEVKRGVISVRDALDARVFALVCAGVLTSDFSIPKLKKYFREQTGAD